MEFHAVILYGPGKALTPFSKARSTGVTKPLLPIANKPMIEYALDWCERAFFPKITVVTDSESQQEITTALDNYKLAKTSRPKVDTEAEVVGSTEEVYEYTTHIDVTVLDTESSGEVLRHLLKSDSLLQFENFVILPCDFITNLPPQVLIEAYRNKSVSDLGLLVYYKNGLEIEDKKNTIFHKNYTIYSEVDDGQLQLLDSYSKEDIEFHKALKVRTQMCWRYPNSTISTQLLDSGIYFGSTSEILNVFEENLHKFTDLYFKTRSVCKVYRDLARRSWKHSTAKESIAFMTVPHQATFFRANNLPVYMEANRYFMKLQAQSQAQGQRQSKDKLLANVGIDSLVGENCELGEKTNVKRTVVGDNCVIGKRVKLTGCLILNNVTIGDDTQLENCIIGHHATLQSKVKLSSCNVESTHEVAKGTQAKGDTLLCFTLEGLVSEDNENAVESSEDESTDSEESEEFYDDYDGQDDFFAY